MSTTTKHYIFTVFFNYNTNKEREYAEKQQTESLVYLRRTFAFKARFSCIARDQNASYLMLKGFCNLNYPCKSGHLKEILGKYSSCKPLYFGDIVNLCRFVHIDKDLMVTGRLPCVGNPNSEKSKPFANDPKFVVRVLLDSIAKNDIEARYLREVDGKMEE